MGSTVSSISVRRVSDQQKKTKNRIGYTQTPSLRPCQSCKRSERLLGSFRQSGGSEAEIATFPHGYSAGLYGSDEEIEAFYASVDRQGPGTMQFSGNCVCHGRFKC